MNSLFLLAKNIIWSNFKRLSFPYKLTLMLTYRCNFRCKICNIWQREIKNELTLEEFGRFFNRSNRFSWINLSGGEIFLRSDFIEIIKVIFKYCRNLYLLDFPTNGFFPESIFKNVKEILKLKPPKLLVTISIDGPRQLHDELRGVAGSWEKALETFKRLRTIRNKNFNVFFGLTLSQYNQNKLFQTFYTLKEKISQLDIRDFHVNIAHTSHHYYGNENMDLIEAEEIKHSIDKFRRLRRFSLNPVMWLEYAYLRRINYYLLTRNSPLPCQALSGSVFIDPYGNIFPCSIFDKNMGNLRDFQFDLARFWHTEYVIRIRNQIEQGKCPGCWTPCEAYQSILANLF